MRYKAGIIQLNITLGEINKNVTNTLSIIQGMLKEGVRLVVLPELWATGFDYKHLKDLAKKMALVLKEVCQIISNDMIVIGTLPEIKEEKLYNVAFVIAKDKMLGSYAKAHLFPLSGEDKYFTPGKKSVVISTILGKIGLLICYDLRFPEMARCLTLKGAEILVIPAAWPLERIAHWRVLLRARAIENQVFVLAANASGTQGKIEMGGHSAIILPDGTYLAEADKPQSVLKAEIDLSDVYKVREKIPCLKSRQPEVYK
jgi:predicted amidohydrolase